MTNTGVRWPPAYDAPVDIPAIDVDALARALDDGCPVIDVREADEYAEVHAVGVTHIPLGTVPDRVADVPNDGPVYVICKSGGRSAKAVEFLRGQGIDAVNVSGGTLAWVEAGHPVERGA